MSSRIVPALARWRFLMLTMLICAWLLLMPVIGGAWRVELLLEACMLAMIQAVTGQFYVAVVVAIFVGMYSRQRQG